MVFEAMLKVARLPDEEAGYRLLTWWDGQGAARVFASAAGALLMERASGAGDLAQIAWSGQDDEACRILCDTAARLHAPRSGPPPDLHPLQEWFQPLFRLAAEHAALAPAASVARQLLAAPREVCPLHGDLHHENVLDFGDRGWLAIALVIFAVWKPDLGILGSFLFGGLMVVHNYIPNLSFGAQELFMMTPYVVTIIVLVAVSMRRKRENLPPASLGLSYFREDR